MEQSSDRLERGVDKVVVLFGLEAEDGKDAVV